MAPFAELEFRIRPLTADRSGYPVSAQLSLNGQDQIFPESLLRIDLDELHNLRNENAAYDARLSHAFEQALTAKAALDKALAQLDQAGGGNLLQVRLLIEQGARELDAVRWECLCDAAGRPLFTGDNVLFSRYLSSSNLRPVPAVTTLRALIAIANPPNLDQAIDPENPEKGLAPVDVANEKARAESGLRGAGMATVTLASPPHGAAPATLANIVHELENGYDVFYLVCHGGLVPDQDRMSPVLWLEDSEDPAPAARLVEGIRGMARQPRLVFLASCQSAGSDALAKSASGSLGALGPMLAEAGVPAVIAMQGNIRMDTMERFVPEFFRELAEDGQIDRAMGKARGRIRDRPDHWMPILFMRLSTGRIWERPATAESTPMPRTLFSDPAGAPAVVPVASLAGPDAQPGEIEPDDPAAWKSIISAPNMPALAIFRSFGQGRVMALGHEHMLTHQDEAGNNDFLRDAIAWLRAEGEPRVVLSVKPTDTLMRFTSRTYSSTVLKNKLRAWGYRVETTEDAGAPGVLDGAGILVIANAWGKFKRKELDAITAFVKGGGGLLAAGLGWSWSQQRPLSQYPMNELLKRFGAQWTANPA